MNQTLELKLQQKLKLTPQLQQSIKLLQLSQLDLAQEIQYQLDSNPLLTTDDSSPDNSADKNSISVDDFNQAEALSASTNQQNNHASAINFEQDIEDISDFREQLEFQLQMANFSELDLEIGYVIIESLNEQGFLTSSREELTKIILEQTNQSVDVSELGAIIHYIQQLEPFGCGSSNRQEFFLLQLQQKKEQTTALSIVKNYYHLLKHSQFLKLHKKLSVSQSDLEQALQLIHNLKQEPNTDNSQSSIDYVTPDIKVTLQDDMWKADIYIKKIPKLAVNTEYSNLLKKSAKKTDKEYLKEKLASARSFIQGLQSRHVTLLNVAQAIVEHQQGFFKLGEQFLKPLKLQDIAEKLGLHESTISRATSNKYLQSPLGVIELKYFFSTALPSTKKGGEWSALAIKSKIKNIIEVESSIKPLSDNKIAKKLEIEGIAIARRTVTKYRESLHIPSSSQRKQLSNFKLSSKRI